MNEYGDEMLQVISFDELGSTWHIFREHFQSMQLGLFTLTCST